MTPAEFVSLSRQMAPDLPDATLLCLLDDARFRYSVCEVLLKTPTVVDRMLSRYILRLYIQSHGNGNWGMSDDIRLCAFVMYKIGNVQDVPLLWEAKCANFDTFCGLDIQMLVGGGVDETIAYLNTVGDDEARKAVEYIEGCREAGDFNSLHKYAEEWNRYFSN